MIDTRTFPVFGPIPVTQRLHAVASRLSREGGYLAEQADVCEAAGRIVVLERALAELLDHIEQAAYRDGTTARPAMALAIRAARETLGTLPSSS